MQFEEFREAVETAERTIVNADAFVGKMATLIRGKLRSSKVGEYTLKRLKKELSNYNARTGCWKED